jgi:hypothetical protein
MPDRFPLRRIAGFVLRFLLVYTALVLPWPGVEAAYRVWFCALGNVAFASVGDGSVRFVPDPQPGSAYDTLLVMTNRNAPGTIGEMNQSSRTVGYLPTAGLIALVMATPIPWRRRWRALGFGLLMLTGFVLLRMALPIIRDFSNPDPLGVFHPGPVARWILGFAIPAFLQAPASQFVGPIFIWALVAFRREDWEIVQPSESAPPDPK